MKLQRTFVLIYTIERRVQGNIAQKNMQDMLQLKILGHDENLSKIARKKYVRTANLKMPSGKVEIGLDESVINPVTPEPEEVKIPEPIKKVEESSGEDVDVEDKDSTEPILDKDTLAKAMNFMAGM